MTITGIPIPATTVIILKNRSRVFIPGLSGFPFGSRMALSQGLSANVPVFFKLRGVGLSAPLTHDRFHAAIHTAPVPTYREQTVGIALEPMCVFANGNIGAHTCESGPAYAAGRIF